MSFLRKIWLISILTFFTFHTALALDSFAVQNIQVEGLQGLSQATVLKYIPVKPGQTITDADTTNIINALYNTGFFSDVSLSRQGNTLIVKVAERPVIASINVKGNSVISTDQINGVFKDLGLVQGQVLDQSVLDQVTKSLKSAYDQQGHYNAIVTTTITPVERNRVNVNINISEGRVALVEKIHIIGNQAFSEKTLINQLTLTEPKWSSFLTRHDHYSRDEFNNSLQALADYYLNHGYLHFKIDSANAVLTPDRKSVYVVIHVTEGAQYKLSGFNFSGNLIVPESQILATPAFKALMPGSVFSKQKIVDATNAITNMLGDKGYAFASVNPIPQINEQNKTVVVTFHVMPGNQVYVRRINFSGNTATADYVLRNSMRQMEGQLYSSSAIQESQRQINLLGFFQNTKENTVPVPGSQNQVDLNYSVTEQPSAQATIGAGYGTEGAVFNAGVNESNFLGTGRQVGVNWTQNPYQRTYSFSYNNPYFTPDGVQRGFNIFNTKTTPGDVNLAPYSFTSYGGNVTYTIPFSAKDNYQVGIGIQRTDLSPGYNPSTQIQEFLKHEGYSFNQSVLNLGWTRNGLDRTPFPTQGLIQSASAQVSAPFIGPDLDYYKLNYQFQGYEPLPKGFIGSIMGAVGYGDGYGGVAGLPFFVNYYAGGLITPGEVRGYEMNSLGPRDSSDDAIGGNALVNGSLQLFLPSPLSGDSFRTSVFVDSGNVYSTWDAYGTYKFHDETGIQLNQLRYSTGIDLQWRLPVLNAMVEFALAKAINPKKNDMTEPFSFNIGGNF